MEIKVMAGDLTNIGTSALVVNLFQGVKDPTGATGVLAQLAMNLVAA